MSNTNIDKPSTSASCTIPQNNPTIPIPVENSLDLSSGGGDPTNGLSGYSATFFSDPSIINRKKKFIRIVYGFPLIWKFDDPLYKSYNARKDAWFQIAESVNLPMVTCKQMWNALCNCYASERREPQSSWMFYKDLEFMEHNFAGDGDKDKNPVNLPKTSSKAARRRRGYFPVSDPEIVDTKNRLINEVYKYPLIWQDDYGDYQAKRNPDITNPIWDQINQVVRLADEKQCRTLWGLLKSTYKKERLRFKKRKKWLYADKLKFLEANFENSAEIMEKQAKWEADQKEAKSRKLIKRTDEERLKIREQSLKDSTDKNAIFKKMKLFQEIYLHEEIWKKKHLSARLSTRSHIGEVWETIGKKTNYSVLEAKSIWEQAKQHYRKLRQRKKSPRWRFFRCLKFLEYNFLGIEEVPVFDFPELDPDQDSKFPIQEAEDNDYIDDYECQEFTGQESPPSSSTSSNFKSIQTSNCLFCHAPPLKSGPIVKAFQHQISRSICWLLELESHLQEQLGTALYCLKCYEFLCDVVHLDNMLKSLKTKIEPARARAKHMLESNYKNCKSKSDNDLLFQIATELGFVAKFDQVNTELHFPAMSAIFSHDKEHIPIENLNTDMDPQNSNMTYIDADDTNFSEPGSGNSNTDSEAEADYECDSYARSRSRPPPRKRKAVELEIKEEPELDDGFVGSSDRSTRFFRLSDLKYEPTDIDLDEEEMITDHVSTSDSEDEEYLPETSSKLRDKRSKDAAEKSSTKTTKSYEMVAVKFGKFQLNYQNYLFRRTGVHGEKTYFYCTQKCGSCLHLKSGKIIKENIIHKHPDDSELIQQLKEADIRRQYKKNRRVSPKKPNPNRKPPPRQITYDFNCPHKGCKKGFMLEFVFKAHLNEHDGDTTPFHCHDCPEKFSTVKEFSNHRGKAHIAGTDSNFQCIPCNLAFPTRIAKLSHDTEHHPAFGTWKPSCRICTKSLETREELLPHESLHKPNEFKCVVCEDESLFDSVEDLVAHVKEIHEKVVCHLCGKLLPKTRINYHLKRHHETKKKEEPKEGFICTECGLHCSTRQKFQRHQQYKHSKVICYCSYPQCSSKTFSCKLSLSNHIRRVHRKHEYTHTCKACNSTFIKLSELKRHEAKYPNGECIHQIKKFKFSKRKSRNQEELGYTSNSEYDNRMFQRW